MGTVNPNLKKLANLSATTFTPIPNLLIPELPAKLQKIDPEGCQKFKQDFERFHQDWVKQVNILQQNQQKILQSLIP